MEIVALIVAVIALVLSGLALAQFRQINQRLQNGPDRIAQSLPPRQEERKLAELAHRIEILEGKAMPLARPDAWATSSSESYNLAPMGNLEMNNAPYMAEIQQLIRENKKIQAIKLFREHTGTGLKEAKDTIDALEAQMRRG